jgi:transcriptional regulator with XRE-family HTH domain
MHGSLPRRLRVLRAERGLALRDAERQTGVDKDTLSKIERGVRHPHDVTLAKIAQGYGVPVEELLEEPVPLGDAPPRLGPSERAALSEEDRRRLLAPIAPAAIAFNAQFGPKVDAKAKDFKDFTIEKFEQVVEAFVLLDRQMADAVSSDYINSDRASDEVREEFNRAWVSMDELRRTLQRAHEELERREAAGVPSIEELAVRRGVA